MVSIEKILSDVEDSFEMGGLSSGLYGDYAAQVAKVAVKKTVEELVARYQSGSLYVSDMNSEVEKVLDMGVFED